VRGVLLAGAWTSGYSTFTMMGRHPYGVLFLDLPANHVDSNVHPTKYDVRLRYDSQVFDAVRRSIAATLKEHARGRFAEQTGSAPSVSISAGSASAAISLFAPAPDDGNQQDVDRLRILAQLHRTFILASDGETLLLVDQHAAHERIAYEAIVTAAAQRTPSEPLLVRGSSSSMRREARRSTGRSKHYARVASRSKAFGERTYRVVATPAGYASRNFDLGGMLDDLSEDPKQRDVRERVWATLACHSVTVAGEPLAPQEMTTLVERLQRCANPMHCPHGRPTMVRLNPDEIARMFKRV